MSDRCADGSAVSASAVHRRMAGLLSAWAAASVLAGAAAWWLSREQDSASRNFADAVAVQFGIWGSIDLLLGLAGLVQTRRSLSGPVADEKYANLQRMLRFNIRINWFWLACGIVLAVFAAGAAWRGSTSTSVASLLGHACGVMIQAGFLFWFDRRFLRLLSIARGKLMG